MKITILTYGTRGDVQPFVALALGLQEAGHSVRLAAPHRFADFAAHYNVPFAPLPGDPEEMSVLTNNVRHDVFGAVKSMAAYVSSITAPVLRAALAACDDADLIVHSFFFTTFAHSLARPQHPRCLCATASHVHAHARLSDDCPAQHSARRAELLYPLADHTGFSIRCTDGIETTASRRTGDFQPEVVLALRYLAPSSDAPILCLWSDHSSPTNDWKAPYAHITGYFFLEEPETYQPPQELLDFLAAGDAPVCVTFGSMVNRESERIGALVRATLAQTRQRGIILTGWGGKTPTEHTDDLFYLKRLCRTTGSFPNANPSPITAE